MPVNPSRSAEPELPRIQAVVLVLDLVESVRLMQQDEAGVIARWRKFTHAVGESVLPAHGGRLVKSLGDGMLLAFASAPHAAAAALACHRLIEADNAGLPEALRMYLRAGLHGTHVFVDSNDIYGSGVNLTARLASIAGPGETIASTSVRDELVDGVDAHLEDLGECEALGEVFLKHVDAPVRAYRVGAVGHRPLVTACADRSASFVPTIAVLPFSSRSPQQPQVEATGDLIADCLIAHLSHARHLRVISRLSTGGLRGRDQSLARIENLLGATYVLSGSFALHEHRLVVFWELADTRDHGIVASERVSGRIEDLLEAHGGFAHEIATQAHDAILGIAVGRVLTQSVPTLESYALLLGGIQLLHRSSLRDFNLSLQVLTRLGERHPRAVEPRIWRAKWYSLRAVQGLSPDPQADARTALGCTAYALDQDPNNSFALAMQGFVHCHLSRDHDAARACLDEAVALNPSETLAQLFSGVMHGMRGEFEAGLASYRLAEATSPLDPARYMMESIGAYLSLGAGRHADAIELARSSLRRNRMHAHSWRILTVAEMELGHEAEARAGLQGVLSLQPGLTTRSYLAGARPGDPTRQRFAKALEAAGLPHD